MASPKLKPLTLSEQERRVLQGWARRRATPQVLALRSRIVLACEGGAPATAVADELGISRATAAKWRSRFLRDRLDGLSDDPRPGRPRTITDEQVTTVVNATLAQAPPGSDPRWSTRSMARDAGLSQTAVSRIWRAFGLQQHDRQTRTLPAGPSGRATIRESIRINNSERDAPPARETSRAKPGRTAMLAAERRDLLLARLARDGKLVARDLAAELGLSEDSLRRDLRELAAAGLCQRVYGGALPITPGVLSTLTARTEVAADSKRRIGAAAARLIAPGTTVILDGGSTALEVAKALPPDLDARIITIGATTAVALADHPRVKVFLLGGELHKQLVSASGAAAAAAAEGVSADLALVTAPGIHPDEGLTTSEPDQAALDRIMISRAADTYIMASIEKLGTFCGYKIVGLSDVAGIITDAPANHPTVRQLRDKGVTIIEATATA
jgi:DeoR/GlpR family transcriptional regulator of sugar metabolism/transposase